MASYPELPERLQPLTTEQLAGLFSSFQVRGLTLRNRFVMPGMQRGFCKDGAPLPELADYYRRRAAGGVALIISESSAVAHVSSQAQPSAARLNSQTMNAWQRCVDAVHDAGGHMLLQLWHEGGMRKNQDGHTLSPSGFGKPGEPNGRAATLEDLDEIVAAFAESARIARAAGADGVEIHAAHGYFLDQMLWPTTNIRADEYGGSDIRNRCRLHTRIVQAVRAECGPEFVISFRFSQWKESDYEARIAHTPTDLQLLLKTLAIAGVDLLHASTRRFWVPEWEGSGLGLAGWTRRLSGLPTIAVGSVGLDKDVMDSLLGGAGVNPRVLSSLHELSRRFGAGEFDLVSIGRSLIADPDWVNKVADGRLEAIRTFRKSDIESLSWE
jgi:2,4-dienoyl-CoA reductase-like NADH-dependent reductase (Old Yellow Enzyme family)